MGENPKLKGKMHNILCFVRKKRCKNVHRKVEAFGSAIFETSQEGDPENRLLFEFLGSGWE